MIINVNTAVNNLKKDFLFLEIQSIMIHIDKRYLNSLISAQQ